MTIITQADVLATIEKAVELIPASLLETARADQVAGWDSLGQLSILVALDKLFDGKIASIAEVAEADSVPKILAILKQHSLL